MRRFNTTGPAPEGGMRAGRRHGAWSRREVLRVGMLGVGVVGAGLLGEAAASPESAASILRGSSQALAAREATAEGVASWGRAEQQIYRTMAQDPMQAAAVLAELAGPEDVAVRSVAEANLHATRSIRGTVGARRTQMPDWRIVAPAPAAVLEGHYRAAQAEFGVPWEILAAIHLVETRMGRLRGVSTAGARGPMQFIPETWARFGEGDIEDDRDAIFAAARHQQHHGAPHDLDRSLWHYNPTDRYVRSVRGYAGVMAADPRRYWLYHAWEVYYATVRGDVRLPEGYALEGSMTVDAWCAAQPGRCP